MSQDSRLLERVNLLVAILARCLKPTMQTALLLGIVMIGFAGYLGVRRGADLLAALRGSGPIRVQSPPGQAPLWPPQRNRTYPDVTLIDQDGNATRLSDFNGKVILVEPVGMSCPACVSFSGGQEKGACGGIEPQRNLESIARYTRRFSHVQLEEVPVVFVQIVLFNRTMQAPSLEDIQEWAKHFGFRREMNQIVLAGTPAMASSASRNLVPGFQLIDKNFILRADSTGHHPTDDLYFDLLPQLQKLVQE